MNSAEPSDDDLWKAWRGGDAQAFATLYARVSPGLYGLCRALAGRRGADDLFQEAFRLALRAAPGYEPRGRLGAWLGAIARNAWRQGLRGRHPAGGPPPGIPEESSAQVCLEALDLLERLPEESREAIALRYLQGMSVSEVAEVLGTSPATVKRRIAEGFRELRNS